MRSASSLQETIHVMAQRVEGQSQTQQRHEAINPLIHGLDLTATAMASIRSGVVEELMTESDAAWAYHGDTMAKVVIHSGK
jgi:hypothetical protein